MLGISYKMRSYKKLQIVASVFVLMFSSNLLGQTGYRDNRMSGVDNAIQQFLNYWYVPGGASVSISKDGRLVYERGFGEIDNTSSRRVYPENKFRIASISKSITAVAIMQLMENNQISLYDKIFGADGILDEYSPTSDSRINDISVYHLLHHLGGWGEAPMFNSLYIADQMGVEPPPNQSVIIEYMMEKNLNADPGTEYQYSNFGYLVLGRVIERITNRSYEDYITENIFDVIGANSFLLAKNKLEEQNPEEAYYFSFLTGESIYGDGTIVPIPYGGFDIEVMDSHGGWVSTASDLIRFATSVDGYPSRPDIISVATRQIMITRSAYSDYAKGWVVGNGNMWHSGSLPGTSSETVCSSSQAITFTIVMNFRIENNINGFMGAMDAAMWEGINSVTEWPEYDLFMETPDAIDPDEGDVIKEIVLNKTNWGSIVWDGYSSLILNKDDNNWYVMDNQTGLTGDSFINPDGALSDASGADWSTANETIFTNQHNLSDGEVWEIDKNGIKRNSWSTGLGNNSRGLAIRDSEIWLALPGNTIYRFGLMGTKLDNVTMDISINSPVSLTWVNNRLWVNDSIDNLVRIFDYSEKKSALTMIKEIPAPYTGLVDMTYTGNEILSTSTNNDIIYWIKTDNANTTEQINAVVDLIQNYPNPFSNSTVINYTVKEPTVLNLSIYNIQGQKIATLVNEFQKPNNYSVQWNCSDDKGNKQKSGIYFYMLKSNKSSVMKKMILIK